jgi:hypothetical protein
VGGSSNTFLRRAKAVLFWRLTHERAPRASLKESQRVAASVQKVSSTLVPLPSGLSSQTVQNLLRRKRPDLPSSTIRRGRSKATNWTSAHCFGPGFSSRKRAAAPGPSERARASRKSDM